MRAVYSIKNIENNKRYIGETMDIKRRWEDHEENLNNNKHHSYKLQQDWNTYGKDKFEFEIIAVLDESISNYIDKYILLIYEGYYIKEYNSISNGYNVENTLIEIMNDRKIIYSNQDKGILKKCYNRIKDEEIKRKGNLIYVAHILNFKDLCDKLSKDSKKVRDLMLQENIIFSNGNKRYSLTNEYKNNDIILENEDKLSNIIFTLTGFESIYNKLKDIHIKPKKEVKKILDASAKAINNTTNITIREYLLQYNLNIPYNDIFKFLRENNVFEYKFRENGKKDNRPTKEYESWFTYEDNTSLKSSDYIKLYVSDIGKIELYKLLYDNMLINNKQ